MQLKNALVKNVGVGHFFGRVLQQRFIEIFFISKIYEFKINLFMRQIKRAFSYSSEKNAGSGSGSF